MKILQILKQGVNQIIANVNVVMHEERVSLEIILFLFSGFMMSEKLYLIA